MSRTVLALALCFSWQAVATAQAPVLPCTGTETLIDPLFGDLDDGSHEVSLTAVFPAGLSLAGDEYDEMFINTNGNVTFGDPFTGFTPNAFPGLDQPTIAPFFADVDLRARGGTANPGDVLYCVEPANNRVMVTWHETVHFRATSPTTSFSRVNTFQMVLTASTVCGVDGAELQFRYEALVWHAGTASGAGPNGICPPTTVGTTCFPAVAGVDYGDTLTAVQLPGSLTSEVTTRLLTDSNVGTPGVWEVPLDPDAIPNCGDGTVDGSCEDCDDAGESATCDIDCTDAECGDGVLNTTSGEDCDEAGETADCDRDCTPVRCGDGLMNAAAGETCDDRNNVDGDGCSALCEAEICGDGAVVGGEICDEGRETRRCDDDCTLVECGDANVNERAGETCDDGRETATCDADCTAPECGDGDLNTLAGELCDDSNTDDGDGCSAECTVEGCGNGRVDAREDCDDSGESATCDLDCTSAVCGDGLRNLTAGEACDDSGESAECNADCSSARCGDGIRNETAGEDCDDAGESATCDLDCTEARCGDDTLNGVAGETCDDGNTTDGDGCDARCRVEPDADAGVDAGVDGGVDAGVDGGVDAAVPPDGGMDAAPEAPGYAGGGCSTGSSGGAPLMWFGLLLLLCRVRRGVV